MPTHFKTKAAVWRLRSLYHLDLKRCRAWNQKMLLTEIHKWVLSMSLPMPGGRGLSSGTVSLPLVLGFAAGGTHRSILRLAAGWGKMMKPQHAWKIRGLIAPRSTLQLVNIWQDPNSWLGQEENAFPSSKFSKAWQLSLGVVQLSGVIAVSQPRGKQETKSISW